MPTGGRTSRHLRHRVGSVRYRRRPLGPTRSFGAGHYLDSLAVGDLNADGTLDVAVANQGSNDVTVRFGDGRGGVADSTTVTVRGRPWSVAVADLNGDGRGVLAVAAEVRNRVTVLRGAPRGFRPSQKFAAGRGPSAVIAADLDNDGRPDLATANQS